jgi:hypothetical protein
MPVFFLFTNRGSIDQSIDNGSIHCELRSHRIESDRSNRIDRINRILKPPALLASIQRENRFRPIRNEISQRYTAGIDSGRSGTKSVSVTLTESTRADQERNRLINVILTESIGCSYSTDDNSRH